MVDSSATRSASCQVMAEIRDLGRLPNRMKRPVGDAQIAENNLANRLRKARAKQQLSKEQEAELERIAGASQPGSEQLAEKLMAEIRDLGRLPRRMKKPVGDAQIAENKLADRLGKARANQELSKEQEAELERIAGAFSAWRKGDG